MYCTNCGKKVELGERFCSGCGKPVEEAEVIRKTFTPKALKSIVIIGIVLVAIIALIVVLLSIRTPGKEILDSEIPSFKSLNFSGFAIPYPDWPVLAEEREDDHSLIAVGINKGSEALVIVGGEYVYPPYLSEQEKEEYGYPTYLSEQEKEDFERELKEEGFKIINLQLNNNSMLVEATIKGEKFDFGGAPFEIELYYSEVYHFFVYQKLGKELVINFFILTLENKWLDYKNIAKYVTNAIESLPLHSPVDNEAEEWYPQEEEVVEEEVSEKETTARAEIRNIDTALALYEADYEIYPLTDNYPYALEGNNPEGIVYMDPVTTTDPWGIDEYGYVSADGTTYTLTCTSAEPNIVIIDGQFQ